MSFTSWFAVGLVLAGLFWAVALAAVFLFAVIVFAGPLAALLVVVLGLILVYVIILALANTRAGRKEKQRVSDELRSGRSFEDVQRDSVGRMRGL
jgi:membrane protein implicated in regulation of membrane protease activity